MTTRFYTISIRLDSGAKLVMHFTNPPTKGEIARQIEQDNPQPEYRAAVERITARVFAENYETTVQELIHNAVPLP